MVRDGHPHFIQVKPARLASLLRAFSFVRQPDGSGFCSSRSVETEPNLQQRESGNEGHGLRGFPSGRTLP